MVKVLSHFAGELADLVVAVALLPVDISGFGSGVLGRSSLECVCMCQWCLCDSIGSWVGASSRAQVGISGGRC